MAQCFEPCWSSAPFSFLERFPNHMKAKRFERRALTTEEAFPFTQTHGHVITSRLWRNDSSGFVGDWDCHSLDPTVWHHPVTWQPSKEGDHLIGCITLSKRSALPREAGSLLGLKVVGGKMTETGRLGAFITKVKKGSLADVVGHLRAGEHFLFL
ncbi:Regulating synaptic membrane exocytosis protein 1 [Liparis tanakae]|uniref:Regulating synaptic membrane exocytosis protein 1 n=1 Tax=Liparis tanakae TaxID=230148 RepID=A0A4Z2EUM4_9TELE|nr:Regulating synaptic membrane exocytosis protein 1 [Liparis tanakae]